MQFYFIDFKFFNSKSRFYSRNFIIVVLSFEMTITFNTTISPFFQARIKNLEQIILKSRSEISIAPYCKFIRLFIIINFLIVHTEAESPEIS